MIHPRTLKVLVVVVLLHVGMLMLIQLGLIPSPLSKNAPEEVMVNIIPATPPAPVRAPEPPKQQPVKQEAPKQVSIAKPVPQPKPAPTPTPSLPPSDNAPVVPAAPPAPPAPPAEAAPAPVPVQSGPISVGVNDIQCEQPTPVYPAMSQKMGEEGRAVVRVSIDAEGAVTNVTVKSTSGSPRLDRAAVAAAQAFKCRPYRQNGRAMSVVADKPYDFKLDN